VAGHRPVEKSTLYGYRENDELENRSALAASTRSVMKRKTSPPGACFVSIVAYGFTGIDSTTELPWQFPDAVGT
jgi:hypothetical protein